MKALSLPVRQKQLLWEQPPPPALFAVAADWRNNGTRSQDSGMLCAAVTTSDEPPLSSLRLGPSTSRLFGYRAAAVASSWGLINHTVGNHHRRQQDGILVSAPWPRDGFLAVLSPVVVLASSRATPLPSPLRAEATGMPGRPKGLTWEPWEQTGDQKSSPMFVFRGQQTPTQLWESLLAVESLAVAWRSLGPPHTISFIKNIIHFHPSILLKNNV